MAFVVQTDQGLESANSYCDVAFADEHLALAGDFDVWDSLATEEKEKYLVTATFFVDDMFEWRGTPVLDYPGLSWPMENVADKYGRAISGVPRILKEGVAEMAMYFAGNDPFADNDLSGIEELSISSLRVVFSSSSSESVIKYPTTTLTKLASLGTSSLGRRRSAQVTAR